MISKIIHILHNPTIMKFAIAMGGVILSAIVLLVILKISKMIFGKPRQYQQAEEDFLKPPETVEDAVNFFINKNRIK